MKRTKVIIIHGKDTTPSQKWYPWLQEAVKKRDLLCEVPAMPNAGNPVLEEWPYCAGYSTNRPR